MSTLDHRLVADIGVGTRDAARASGRSARYVAGTVLGVLLLWFGLLLTSGAMAQGPGGRAFGEDFDVYFAAATMVRSGDNPYDARLLYRTESRILRAEGLRVLEPRSLVRVGSPPLLFLALQPLTLLPFRLAVIGWTVAMLILVVIGFLGMLRAAGWRRRLAPLLLFLLLPAVDQGVLYGEITAIYFAAIGLALGCGRRYPAAAGALLSVAWIKPPLAIPLAAVVLLFYLEDRRSALLGFSGATVGLALLMLLTSGWQGVAYWEHGMLSFSSTMASQPGLVSLTGFYVKWAPVGLRLGLEATALALAVGCTCVIRRRSRMGAATDLAIATLWPLWMLCAPYGHFPDEMLLAVPAVAVLGRDGRDVVSGPGVLVLFGGALSLWLALGNSLPVQLTPCGPILVLLCVLWASHSGRRALSPVRAVSPPPAVAPAAGTTP